MPSSVPSVIYHLRLPGPTPEAPYAPESLTREGFIHFSTAEQLERTANRFYQQVPELEVWEVKVESLRAELRWEEAEPGEAPFPHLYGPLNLEAVQRQVLWSREDSGTYGRPPL